MVADIGREMFGSLGSLFVIGSQVCCVIEVYLPLGRAHACKEQEHHALNLVEVAYDGLSAASEWPVSLKAVANSDDSRINTSY